MLFNYKPLNADFQFDNNKYVNIVIENKYWFYKFIKSLNNITNNINDDFIFDKETESNFKNMNYIYSPIDLNTNKISNKLANYLISNECCNDYDYIKSKLIAFGDNIILESGLDIEFEDDQLTLQKILKLYNFSFFDNSDNYAEQLTNYLDFSNKIAPKVTYCLINSHCYLEPNDLKMILEWCKLNGIFLLNIASEYMKSYNYDKTYIFDKDLCFIG